MWVHKLYDADHFGNEGPWFVGYYVGEAFHRMDDYKTEEEAAARVHYLNGGGKPEPTPRELAVSLVRHVVERQKLYDAAMQMIAAGEEADWVPAAAEAIKELKLVCAQVEETDGKNKGLPL